MKPKRLSQFVRTYPGDKQGSDYNMRALTTVVPDHAARIEALEKRPVAEAPTEQSAPALTLPLETLANGSIGLKVVIDDGGVNQPLQVDDNTGGLYIKQATAQPDSVAAVLATLVADFNTLLASLRAAGHIKT